MKLGQKRHAAPVVSTPAPRAHQAVRPTDLDVAPGGARLGDLAVASGLVSEADLVDALRILQGGVDQRLGNLLVERKAVSERDLANLLAQQASLDVIDLRQVSPDPAAVALVTEELARRLVVIPIAIEDDAVLVAVADPTPAALSELRQAMGRSIRAAVAAESDIVNAIGRAFRALAAVESQVTAFETLDSLKKDSAQADAFGDLAADETAPVVKVVQLIITQGLRDRASDIHIEPQLGRVRVRFRIDGALHDVLDLPGSMGPAIASRIKILADMNIVERRRPQDGQISMSVESRDVDIRVATTATIGGEKVVMRLLDKSRPLFQLAQLGMPADTVKRYSALLHSPYGMVICAGPTGSGKTTTLYGSLGELNDPSRNIMTIEDPVEYTFPSINQIQINEQAGVTFATGLKSILRQDPDIILVGEVRDLETARIAVQSALTGHLVLSSVHATDAVSALHRLVDMGIETFLVASSVTAVVAQRLVRRVCTHCIVKYTPSPEELEFLRLIGGKKPTGGFVRGAGCNFCSMTGYHERIGVYEMLEVTEGIRSLILERGSHDDLRVLAKSEGMRTLLDDATALISTGVTTIAEILRSIYVTGQ